MLTKVISGGQTGVDQAALRAAYGCGILTGGTAPKGYRTEDGPDPTLKSFGLVEHESPGYPPRTLQNVIDADGTLLIAADWYSPGERHTMACIEQEQKPSLCIDMETVDVDEGVKRVLRWIRMTQIKVLNVAGHRENNHPGIGKWAEKFLTAVFIADKKQ